MAAGDVTYSSLPGLLGQSGFASGVVECDADTDVNVLCGFVPRKIQLFYKDDGATAQDKICTWFKGMTLTHYWFQVMLTGAIVLVPVNGPVPYGDLSDPETVGDGEVTLGQGFTIPAALMDNDADVIYWMAWR